MPWDVSLDELLGGTLEENENVKKVSSSQMRRVAARLCMARMSPACHRRPFLCRTVPAWPIKDPQLCCVALCGLWLCGVGLHGQLSSRERFPPTSAKLGMPAFSHLFLTVNRDTLLLTAKNQRTLSGRLDLCGHPKKTTPQTMRPHLSCSSSFLGFPKVTQRADAFRTASLPKKTTCGLYSFSCIRTGKKDLPHLSRPRSCISCSKTT